MRTGRPHLVWREIVQQLTDVVVILTLPVVASPSDTVFPVAWFVCHQALVYCLQHLQWLSSRELQSALHKLWVSGEGYEYYILKWLTAPWVANLQGCLRWRELTSDTARHFQQAAWKVPQTHHEPTKRVRGWINNKKSVQVNAST